MTMRAVRLHPAPKGSPPYTPTNPAPTSALHIDTIPIPTPTPTKNELLIKITASTIVRDTLSWPETFSREFFIPGNDLAGTVVEVSNPESKFQVGDEIFGMTSADRCGTWAEYALVLEEEVARKPGVFSWEEAAALPLSAMSALEALKHAGVEVEVPTDEDAVTGQKSSATRKTLITGAAGAVGVYAVQLAKIAGLHVTAATSSNDRNAAFLKGLGAHETIEYSVLKTPAHQNAYDIIIDTVGGQTLLDAWGNVKENGSLVTLDSSSWDFVNEHAKLGIGKDGVKALFFIVEGGTKNLDILACLADLCVLQVFVLDSYPLEKVREAYERANGRLTGSGKILLTV
ncbi:NAD(P)-binding protein [Aspergillus crustosus]